MAWEDTYKKATEGVWQLKADSLLVELAPSIPKGKVLDLGMGEGRNALFFAQLGYEVAGVDSAPTAIQRASERAQAMNLSLDARVGDIRELEIAPDSLSLVISTMTLQFMKYTESKTILERIATGLKTGGFVYLTVFSTEEGHLDTLIPLESEANTFFNERRNMHIHFFEKDDLLKPLAGLKLHHISQTISLDLGHPGVPYEHYHGIMSYIGQKV